MDLKGIVQEKYGAAAQRVADGSRSGCCGASALSDGCCDPITANLYNEGQAGEIPEAALQASLGCGNPTALAFAPFRSKRKYVLEVTQGAFCFVTNDGLD